MPAQTGTILYFVVLIAIAYFLLIRPQQKQAKERKNMLNSVKGGDAIVTNSGICGKIIRLKEDYFILETGPDRVKLRMRRDAIAYIEKSGKEKPEEDATEQAESASEE